VAALNVADVTEEVVDTIEGPHGAADILEIMRPVAGAGTDIEYAVVFAGKRTDFRSLGEAHILANQLTGTADED
jgi:hypothetical protein